MYLVIINTTSDNKIAKFQEYSTRDAADAHVAKVLSNYPDAFVVDNPAPYVLSHTTVDVAAKTITYDSSGFDAHTLMEKWLSDIRASDSILPRWGEDILDRDGIEDLPQAFIDKYNAKKTLRSERPK